MPLSVPTDVTASPSRVPFLRVNGARCAVDAVPERSLLSVLRDDLDLTGAKYGCGIAQCGACVVLVDGEAKPACHLAVGEVGEREVSTLEGLACGDRLHPVQQAFLQAGAMQCGYCTPGMIMEAVALLEADPHASDEAIGRAMERHICRCGVYAPILEAIRAAAIAMQATAQATALQSGESGEGKLA